MSLALGSCLRLFALLQSCLRNLNKSWWTIHMFRWSCSTWVLQWKSPQVLHQQSWPLKGQLSSLKSRMTLPSTNSKKNTQTRLLKTQWWCQFLSAPSLTTGSLWTTSSLKSSSRQPYSSTKSMKIRRLQSTCKPNRWSSCNLPLSKTQWWAWVWAWVAHHQVVWAAWVLAQWDLEECHSEKAVPKKQQQLSLPYLYLNWTRSTNSC